MRVALLSRGAHPLHEPGGMERAVYHLAKHLQRRGVETVLLTRPAADRCELRLYGIRGETRELLESYTLALR